MIQLAENPTNSDGCGSLPLASGRAPSFVSDCGRVTLYNADCRDVLPALANVDAVISDPPYGMDWNTDSTRFSGGNRIEDRGEGREWKRIEEDAAPFDPTPWTTFPRCVLFGANHYGARLPVGTTLIWLKKGDHLFGTFLSDAELAWMKGGHGVYAFRQEWSPQHKANDLNGGGKPCSAHPCQKPIALMAWSMDKAKVAEGMTVLDPYMGSGTTGIACIRTGRRFVGVEKDPAHYATALARIKRELAQGDLFLDSPNDQGQPRGAKTTDSSSSP